MRLNCSNYLDILHYLGFHFVYDMFSMVVLCVIFTVGTSGGLAGGCPVLIDDVPVQQTFEIDRILGTWYGTHRIPVSGVPEAGKQLYKKTSGGSYEVENDVRLGNNCLYLPSVITQDRNEPAKMVFNDINNLDVWILSTDYETYALGYSCIDEGPGGYCDSEAITLWQRCPDTIDDDTMQMVENILADICIDAGLLQEELQFGVDQCFPNECLSDDCLSEKCKSGRASLLQPTLYVIFTLQTIGYQLVQTLYYL